MSFTCFSRQRSRFPMPLNNRHCGRRSLAMLLVVSVMLVIASTHSIAHLRVVVLAHAASKLERRFAAAPLRGSHDVTGFIVLGGSKSRAHAALKLGQAFPQALIILSGPDADEVAVFGDKSSHRGRLIVDRSPRTTFENALFSKALARPTSGERWIIVTSAIHMPRSIGAFRAVGFQVEPWPVHDTPEQKVHAAPMVEHEIVGLLFYWLRGRSPEIFPAPQS